MRLDIAAMMRLIDLTDYIVPHTIRAVAELGVADELAAGPRTVAELARAAGADEPALLRALRALACNGVFTEEPPGTFALTGPAELLRSGHPYSERDHLAMRPVELYAWADYHETMRTGAPAYPRVTGGAYPAAKDGTRGLAEIDALLSAYPWGRLGGVSDAGGGAALLSALPPPAGSGPPALVLVRALCALPDDAALELLRTLRSTMSPDHRLLVAEPVRGTGTGALEDLFLLVFTGGRIRTPDETGALFTAAGLRTVAVHPSATIPIVEAVPC